MDNGGTFTDRLIAEVDIPSGAKALDIGCGPGDVTFRLSRIVGPEGRVVGVDLNANAVARARKQASERGFENTTFLTQDFRELARAGEKFDVITCRRVLMYLSDKQMAANDCFRLLKPNGILLIQEHDAAMRFPAPDRPLAAQAQGWIWDTVEHEGANPSTGFQLHSLLSNAGFTDISILAEAVVETPGQMANTAAIVRAMLPRIEAAQVATANEIDIDTLEKRLLAERLKSESTSISGMVFGAVARLK